MDLSSFPKELKQNALRKGAVLKMEMDRKDGITPKHGEDKIKWFVILSIDQDKLVAASLIINSDINDNLFFKIGLYQHQVYSSDYDFLDHDSFVDGYTLHEFRTERILSEATYLGCLEENDVQESIDHLIDSGNVKPIVLKKYGLSHSR